MTDPERFLDHPPSELGALLLRAGSEEGPSHRSLQRTLSALGVGVTALGAATSASALSTAATAATAGLGAGAAAAAGTKWAGSLGVVVLAKWGGVGMASGIAVALAVHGGTAAVQSGPVAALSTAPAVVTSVPSPVEASPHALHAIETERAAPEPPAAVASGAKPSTIVAEEEVAPLAAEVAFVDRGRAAYQHGDALGAERALSGYEAEFTEPRLLPEVLYLRMEVATQRGERARAVALAERILRQYARSPHAARARLVLREE